MTRFAILQLRPEDEAADEEFAAFLTRGGLSRDQVDRFRLDQAPLPTGFDPADYAGVIVGGGPGCVSDPPETKSQAEARIEAEILALMPEITERDLPFLGCCYGIGILAHHLGGDVSKARYGEPVGPVTVRLSPDGATDPLTSGLPLQFDALVGHKEALQALPPGCAQLIEGDGCPFQMIRYGQNVYATQFHPEANGDSFALRIRVYRDKGYFAPHEAETLTDVCQSADVTASTDVLRRFVERYS